MRVIKCITLFCFLSVSLHAQTILFYLAGGGMNYGGDLQTSKFTFTQSHPYVRGGLGIKINDHFSIYYSLGTGKVGASDTKAPPNTKTYRRNLSFFSEIGETDLTLEYNLIDISGIKNFTPYGFAGIGAFRFKPYTFDTAGNKVYLQPLGTEGQEIPG